MKRKLIALVLCAMLIAMMMPVPALAVGDTTPPELISITVDKTELSVGDKLTVTVKANDAVSGLDNTQCKLDVIGEKFGVTDTPDLIGSDTLVFEYYVTMNWVSGIYHVYGLTLTDNQHNRVYLSIHNGTLPDDNLITVHANDSRTDWTGPELTTFGISTRTAAVGDSVTISIKASDPSGVKSCRVQVFHNTYSLSKYYDLHSLPGVDSRYEGTFSISSDMYDGKYYFMIILEDYCGSISYRGNSDTDVLGALDVDNPMNVYQQREPIVNSLAMQNEVKAGDSIIFSANISMNGLICNPENLETAYLSIYRVMWGGTRDYYQVPLQKVGTGEYRGSFAVPESWPDSELFVSVIGFKIGSMLEIGTKWDDKFLDKSGKRKDLVIQVQPVFAGTTNMTVLLGSSFNPLAGVSALNLSEGDMTSKIEVSSNVDTSKVGLYLVKYKVRSSKANAYYYDFRWVGVSAVQPNPAICDPGTLVITGGNVNIDTNGSTALLTRDGVAVSLASSVSSPGKYTVSLADGSSKSGKFTISRISPAISASFQGSYPSKLTVAVKCSDPTGIAETRWMAGNVSLDTVRAQGKTFRNTFVTNQFGDCTVYARNKLGNETVKKVTLQYTAVTGVSVSTSSVKLAVGQTCQLAPILAPATCTFPNVIWSSSNPAVARVGTNGLIEALSPGSARIMVRALDGGKTSFCVVSVMAPPEVVSVVISSTSKTVCLGSLFKLTATVSPSGAACKTITWSSSNTRVVAVGASGSFRAIGVGTATIYAKANNGAYAVCKITVTPELVQAGPR